MSKRIYVGNMSFSTTEDELRDLFAAHGEVVDVSIVYDRATGRHRGFGFVEMANEQQANAAIAALNNQNFGGRALRVDSARDRGR